jgi:hypothetical protein
LVSVLLVKTAILNSVKQALTQGHTNIMPVGLTDVKWHSNHGKCVQMKSSSATNMAPVDDPVVDHISTKFDQAASNHRNYRLVAKNKNCILVGVQKDESQMPGQYVLGSGSQPAPRDDCRGVRVLLATSN